MKKIYLASPYSHENSKIRLARFESVSMVAARLMRQGNIVFSPISHSHPIAQYMPEDFICDFEFWMKQDLPHLKDWADELHILCLNGWANSRGVLREIEYWNTIKTKAIEYIYL